MSPESSDLNSLYSLDPQQYKNMNITEINKDKVRIVSNVSAGVYVPSELPEAKIGTHTYKKVIAAAPEGFKKIRKML